MICDPGESDGRKLEDLETIYWHKQPVSKNEELNEYFSVAKLVSLFTRYKMFEKSKSEREQHSSSQQSSKTPSSKEHESTVANNGIANREEVVNGCVSEPSHQSLDQQLMDIYTFVSSHHPPAKNEGCSSSSATSPSHKDEWTVKEARLFASALEIYGKNFGAIKKAIPWKPVKSLMEHYYSSNEDGTSDEDDDYMSPKETEFLSAKSKNQTFQTLTVATCLTPQVATLFNGLSNDFSLKQGFSIKDANGTGLNGTGLNGNGLNGTGLNGTGLNGNGLLVPGQEVKPLKAKPVMKNQVLEPVNGNSLLGSLKFFMDGQLVLKLNAKQQEMNKKCSWVESLDTPKIPKPVLKKKHFPRSFKIESIDSGSIPDSGRSSVRSDETGETESSDDDSLGSADSRSLLDSPSFLPRFRTGTKVKMESNCQVPPFPFIASPPSSHLPSSHPSTPGSTRDGSVNESSKLCTSDNQKRGVSESHLLHALLLPEAKKRLSPKSKSSDPHHDLLPNNHEDSEVKMKLIQDRLEFPSLYSPFRTSSHGQIANGENNAVDLSCKPSPTTNSISEAIDLSSDKSSQKGKSYNLISCKYSNSLTSCATRF